MKSKYAAIRRKGSGKKDGGNKSCSWVMTISWMIILAWLVFLFFCYRSGQLQTAKLPASYVNRISSMLDRVDHSLRGATHDLVHLYPPSTTTKTASEVSNPIAVAPAIPPKEPPQSPKIPPPVTTVKVTIPLTRPPTLPPKIVLPQTPPPVISVPVASGDKSDIVHIIFSTDCTPYQDYQTIVLFHSALVVGQKGPVTRIASGCDDEKKHNLTELYRKLYPQYHVHYTPDFKKDDKTGRSYDFYNKPWGLKHWLQHANPPIPPHTVIALLDPDMIFVRPITPQMRGQPNNVYNKHLYKSEEDILDRVVEGHPVAQLYGLGAPWQNDQHKKFNRTYICGSGSPCLEPTAPFGENHYAVGPPYIAVKEDFLKIAATWTKFVPRVYEGYPYLLAEMYAYSMAAAHEKLPHVQFEHLMVSNTDAGGEGWPLIDKLENACLPPVNGIFLPGIPLPTVVHYCQNFRAGDLSFAKRQVHRKNIFTCDHPLFKEPPIDLDKVDYRIKAGEKQELKSRQVKRNAYTLCIIHHAINAAMINYKQVMCKNNDQTNYNKTYVAVPVH